MWFLQASQGANRKVLPVEGGAGVTFGEIYYPVPPGGSSERVPYSPDAPVIAKVLLELATAAEHFGGGHGWGDRMMIALRRVDASVVRDVYQRLAQSPSAKVSVMGLAGLIRLGDASAMIRVEKDVHLFTDPPERLALLTCVQDFRSPDAAAVRALGRLAARG